MSGAHAPGSACMHAPVYRAGYIHSIYTANNNMEVAYSVAVWHT